MYNRRNSYFEKSENKDKEIDRWSASAILARAFASFIFGAAVSFLISLFFIFDMGLDPILLAILACITLTWTILGIFYCEKMLAIGQKVLEDLINLMGRGIR